MNHAVFLNWKSCSLEASAWFNARDILLSIVATPSFFLPLLAVSTLAFSRCFRLNSWQTVLIVSLVPLAASFLYSSITTFLLTAWLAQQVPLVTEPPMGLPVAVLVGRGGDIAFATTSLAASRLARGEVRAIYVSGDELSTGYLLLKLGVPSVKLAGDSCARTTWQNATLTAAWLRQHYPGAPVQVITDPWQLARASRSFARQDLSVIPVPVTPNLHAHTQNRLALRETAATVLYRLQGRI